VLGVIGVVAAFGLFYLAERVFHMDRLTAQTLMYLKLSVAGHLTIFLTRTRGPFWSIRPAKILWMAVLGTQTIATLIAVYGLFMAPLGWKWAGFVWGYAIAWALINDRIKLLAYKIFDPVKGEPKAETKGEPKPDAKAEPKPDAKADEPKPETKTDEPKPEAKAASDLTPQIAARAYELYGERAGNDGTAVQDWKKAEQEIRNDEAEAAAKPEAKVEPKPGAKADEPSPAPKAEQPKPNAKAEPKPDAKAEPKPDTKADTPAPEAKADEQKPEAKDKTQPDATPQLVKRVHGLYEQLGREDVQTVQNFEKAEPELKNNESKK
jgi:H+-transporting ATPase